jgi:hypothetical protein
MSGGSLRPAFLISAIRASASIAAGRSPFRFEGAVRIGERDLEALIECDPGEQGRAYWAGLASTVADIETVSIGRMLSGRETSASDAG